MVANKFKDFGPAYVINLRDREDRRSYIESHFAAYGVTNYQFYEAHDARHLDGKYLVSGGHIGCTLSHLNLIREWYLSTNDPYVIICEDDLSLDNSEYWSWSWVDFISSIKFDFDILHISTSSLEFGVPEQLSVKRKYPGETGLLTSCYIISRSGARQVIDKTIGLDGKTSIDFDDERSMADHGIIFGNVDRYFMFPLLTPAGNLGSDTSNDDPDYIRFHNMNYDHCKWLWKYNQRSIEELTLYLE